MKRKESSRPVIIRGRLVRFGGFLRVERKVCRPLAVQFGHHRRKLSHAMA